MAFRRRLLRLFVIAFFAFVAIWVRVIQLQVFEGDEWAERARRKRQRVVDLPAPRGRIVDRHGQVVARDVPIFQLALVGREWQRRARLRCSACGALHFYEVGGRAPTRPCPCREPASVLEPAPLPDLSELEALLALPPGEIAKRADERVAKVGELVGLRRERLLAEGNYQFLLKHKLDTFEFDMLLRPYVIVPRLPPEAVRLIELDDEGTYRGFRVRTDLRREYAPNGPASQLLGYVSVVHDRKELERLRDLYGDNVTLDTRVGRAGLEKALQALLLGRKGFLREARDSGGDFSIVIEEDRPERGNEIRLALTTEACLRAEKAMGNWAKREGYFPQAQPSGGFVALRADTGAVVAWGELPRLDVSQDLARLFEDADAKAHFDPEVGQWCPPEGASLPEGETLDEWRARLSKPAPLHLSRVDRVAVEPGSTFKVFIGLGLLEGLRHMPQGTHLPYEGAFVCGGRRFIPGCHHHAPVSFEGAIETSCNRYFALSLREFGSHWPVYRRTVPALLSRLGFGELTGVDVAGEGAGTFLQDWVDFDPRAVAQAAVREARAAPREGQAGARAVELRVGSRLPAKVAGRDPARLEDLLDLVLGEALRVAPGGRVVLTLAGGTRENRYVDVRFDVSAQPHPDGPAPEPLDTEGLTRAVARLGGALEADVKAGGVVTLSFTLGYHDAIGVGPGEPPVILADDGRNFAIGQGPIAVTPLQMARAVAALANGGRLVTPTVALSAGDAPLGEQAPYLGLDPDDLRRVREGMRRVASGSQGTARGTPWHTVPATVYGKTGTAQAGSWWARGIPAREREGPWHHWFVGFAEAPGVPTLAFACVLHSRTEPSAAHTAVNAVQEFLAWWFTAGPDVAK